MHFFGSHKTTARRHASAVFLFACSLGLAQSVVINEVAWMGTTTSANDEWVELHNYGGSSVDLSGWTLNATDGTPSITLSGTIPAHGYFLLERTDDTSVAGIAADQIYTGALSNSGETLELRDGGAALIDSVNAWHAGDNSSKATMSRISSLGSGTAAANWEDAAASYGGGYGTPRAANKGVVINEIAWMGTSTSANDEWIELHNPGNASVDVSGWTLNATDGTPSITLSGTIAAGGFFLLERTDDTTVAGVAANQIYTGAMSNSGEVLELRDGGSALIDSVDAWHAGDNATKAAMSRKTASAAGTDASNWENATATYSGGYGTPGVANSGPNYSNAWYDVYFTDHVNTVVPGATGPKATSQALIAAIDNATTSIDFALYGLGGAEDVLDALVDAVGRGVTVRGVADTSATGYYSYSDTDLLISSLPAGAVVTDDDDRIMHNKFFVFDDRYVWTGSGNLSDTGIYWEYNANWSILIDHVQLAAAYKTEFNEMYAGDFHTDKTDNTTHIFPILSDGTEIRSYFAPTDDAVTNAILPAINGAVSTLDCRIFYFTRTDVRDALIAAHNRGVTVRMIIDASGAESQYSVHEDLRTAGIDVKVENWPGKEHMKALAADNEVVILGSQNWTGSGNTDSDENTLYIKNTTLAQAYTTDFNANWASIPNTWLAGNPGAESANSPGTLYDFIDNDHDHLTDEGAPEQINTVSNATGAINVYFNKSAFTSANQGSLANHNVNLETRLLNRINAATTTIDFATYELNLPDLLQALLNRAAAGVRVRVVADAKDYDEGESNNWDTFRIYLEKMARGNDGTPGTADDIVILADSPILAVVDTTKRTGAGLPSTPTGFTSQTLNIGNGSKTGHFICLGELKNSTDYYSPGPQMHNKFVVIDSDWVWTGSWNFTINGLYGDEANRVAGILGGNTNHGVEIRSGTVAGIYTTEFEEMWGSSTGAPDSAAADFHGRKTDNTTHVVTVGGRTVEIYFSPGDGALGKITNYVANNADLSARFCIFAWSDQGFVDALKVKYEGSALDQTGSPTGFEVEGVFDSVFWNQWWSASVDMTGRTASQTSVNNPNIRWNNIPAVYKDREDEILHHKYMIIDGHSNSNPAVITGSTNWSANGDTLNDENLLIIHDADIADQFMQEFLARFYATSGILP